MRKTLAATLFPVVGMLAFSSCKTADTPTQGIPQETTALAADNSGQTDHKMLSGPSIGPRTHGVPHSANIDMVVLSDDGRMALTRDSLGGLRLWPSLDGASEPALVPIRGALNVSLASAGTSTIISAIDNIGSLHILEAKSDGSMKELYMSSPHTPMAEAIVLSGGESLAVLSKDYRLSLMSKTGKVQSEIEERRFRPTSIRAAQDKRLLLAIESDVSSAGSEVVLKTVDYDLAKTTLALRPGEQDLTGVFNVAHKRFDLSPDGTLVAYLGTNPVKGNTSVEEAIAPRGPRPARPPLTPSLQVANIETGAVQSIDLPVPAHEFISVSVAFSGDSEVLLSSRPSGGSWKVTLGEKVSNTPIPSAVANDTQRSASDVARGVRVAADGTWLFVQDVAKKSHHYLGYSAFDPQSASISPNGENVAWSTGAMVYVESVNENSKSIRISAPQTEAYFRSAFIDDAHLVAIDYSGGLHLIDWAEGKQTASLDTGGPVREFEIDQERKLVRGINQKGGSWIVELGSSGLAGPYLIQDGGYRSGFLKGEKGIWSMDSSNKLRSYELAEIRKGLGTEELKRDAIDVSSKLPTAVDVNGRHYLLRSDNKGAKLTVGVPGGQKKQLRLSTTPAQIVPSPDGSKLALKSSSSTMVEVVSADDARSLWSRSFMQGIRDMSWSADSASLAVASQVGAIVQDAETGETARLSCAPWFEKRETPPASTVSFLTIQNLCERGTGEPGNASKLTP